MYVASACFQLPSFSISSLFCYTHTHTQCNPDGRTSDDAQNILVNEEKFVSQLESDPLIVMDGLL